MLLLSNYWFAMQLIWILMTVKQNSAHQPSMKKPRILMMIKLIKEMLQLPPMKLHEISRILIEVFSLRNSASDSQNM